MPWKQRAKCNENNEIHTKKKKSADTCRVVVSIAKCLTPLCLSRPISLYSIVHFKSMVDVKIKLHAKPTYVPCTRTCIYLTIRYTQIIYLCNIQPNKTVSTKKKYLEIFGTKQSYTKRKMHPWTNDSLGTGTRRQSKRQLREAHRRTSITMRYSAGI